MDFYDNMVKFEVECKTCSTSFHYLQKIGGFIAPKCPECGEEYNLECKTQEIRIQGVTITYATVDGRE